MTPAMRGSFLSVSEMRGIPTPGVLLQRVGKMKKRREIAKCEVQKSAQEREKKRDSASSPVKSGSAETNGRRRGAVKPGETRENNRLCERSAHSYIP